MPMLHRVKVKLYALPGSHPCAAVEVALRCKSIEYERVDLLPLRQLVVGPLLYGGNTVPGVKIDKERLAGSRTIMRRLDALVPEPALLATAVRRGGARASVGGGAVGRRGAAERAQAPARRGFPARSGLHGELRGRREDAVATRRCCARRCR